MKKASLVKEKSDQELVALLVEKREALRQNRFGRSTASGGNVKSTKGFRKEVARILTEQSARLRSAEKKA